MKFFPTAKANPPALAFSACAVIPTLETSCVDYSGGLDRFGRVKDNRWHKAGTDLDRIKYGYDRASNRIWRENPVATANSAEFDEIYSYDAIQRLKTMARGALNVSHTALTSETFGQCWQLDATGNWQGFKETDNGSTWTLEQTRNANTVNEITDITNTVGSAWAQAAYSPVGNMTTIPQGNDPTKDYVATYDAWNRLVKLEEEVSSVLQPIVDYQYDGRKFQIVLKEYTSGTLPTTCRKYYTDAWQEIEVVQGISITPSEHYVWGSRYIDDLVLRDKCTNEEFDERRYALQDANWNITSITSPSGAVRCRFSYSSYGSPMFLDPTFLQACRDHNWRHLFCGQPFINAMQLMLARNRAYSPLLGSWVQMDPKASTPKNELFVYVKSNPLNLIDPFGLEVHYYPFDTYPPFPDAAGKETKHTNNRTWLGYSCGRFSCPKKKSDRLKPLPSQGPAPRRPPIGPSSGHHKYLSPPYNGPVGSGGANGCVIVVIKCADGAAVYHFTAGDDPFSTITGFNGVSPQRDWTLAGPCEAIMCGSDANDSESQCLADQALAAIPVPVVGVMANSACGFNEDGTWYATLN